MKEKNSSFFKTYYILMIVFAIIGLMDASFAYLNETIGEVLIWSMIASIFSLGVFILSIIAIVKFIKNKFAKITLFIPIYHIVFQIVLFVFGIVWGIIGIAAGIPLESLTIPFWFSIVGAMSSLFELVFLGYLLNKFK